MSRLTQDGTAVFVTRAKPLDYLIFDTSYLILDTGTLLRNVA